MTADQLRSALKELTGHCDLSVVFADVHPGSAGGYPAALDLKNALLIPDEPDHMVKVTDGKSVYVLDAQRVAYLRIGLKKLM